MELQAKIENIPAFIGFVQRSASEHFNHENQIQKIRLAVEESISNIIHHSKSNAIKAECIADDQNFKIRITDKGKPFDLNQYETSQQEMGGLGIPLIRKITSKIAYKREDDRNILELCFSKPLKQK